MALGLREPAPLKWGMLLAICVFGCQPRAPVSDSQRAESFAALSKVKVAGEPLETFLRKRTAVLVAWASGGGQGQIALASAIDSRGYFLTAAHCVRESAVYLGYMDSDGIRLARARVVAMPTDPNRYDFALVAVEGAVPYAFGWSDAREFAPNHAAAAVGLNFPGNRSGVTALGVPTCVAGRVLSVQPMGSLAMRIRHDLPLRPGDSGGPLVSSDGKLIGVNTGAAQPGASLAIRPDPAWVGKAISEDLGRPAP